jgi:hypothetical protein
MHDVIPYLAKSLHDRVDRCIETANKFENLDQLIHGEVVPLQQFLDASDVNAFGLQKSQPATLYLPFYNGLCE